MRIIRKEQWGPLGGGGAWLRRRRRGSRRQRRAGVRWEVGGGRINGERGWDLSSVGISQRGSGVDRSQSLFYIVPQEKNVNKSQSNWLD